MEGSCIAACTHLSRVPGAAPELHTPSIPSIAHVLQVISGHLQLLFTPIVGGFSNPLTPARSPCCTPCKRFRSHGCSTPHEGQFRRCRRYAAPCVPLSGRLRARHAHTWCPCPERLRTRARRREPAARTRAGRPGGPTARRPGGMRHSWRGRAPTAGRRARSVSPTTRSSRRRRISHTGTRVCARACALARSARRAPPRRVWQAQRCCRRLHSTPRKPLQGGARVRGRLVTPKDGGEAHTLRAVVHLFSVPLRHIRVMLRCVAGD